MTKKRSSKKMAKRPKMAASAGTAALMGALGGAAVMLLSGDRLRAGLDRLRPRRAE